MGASTRGQATASIPVPRRSPAHEAVWGCSRAPRQGTLTSTHSLHPPHTHTHTQGKLRGLAFTYLHFLLGCALNTAGAGLLLALETYGGGKGEETSYKADRAVAGGEFEPHVRAGKPMGPRQRGRQA